MAGAIRSATLLFLYVPNPPRRDIQDCPSRVNAAISATHVSTACLPMVSSGCVNIYRLDQFFVISHVLSLIKRLGWSYNICYGMCEMFHQWEL